MSILLPSHADVLTIMMDPLGALYIAVDDSLMAISDADYCGCQLSSHTKGKFPTWPGNSVDVLCVLRKS